MKNSGGIMFMVLFALALVSFACAEALSTKKADETSRAVTEGKQHGTLKIGNELAQNDISGERYNVQFSGKPLGGITKFENVPADEESLIKDMEILLQEKMSMDYPEGQTKRDAHPKTLACLQAEFIIEPDIPAELKKGIFKFPQTYPAWIRISSASGNIQSDKVKDLLGFAIKIMGVKGQRFQTQNDEKKTQDFVLLSYRNILYFERSENVN